MKRFVFLFHWLINSILIFIQGVSSNICPVDYMMLAFSPTSMNSISIFLMSDSATQKKTEFYLDHDARLYFSSSIDNFICSFLWCKIVFLYQVIDKGNELATPETVKMMSHFLREFGRAIPRSSWDLMLLSMNSEQQQVLLSMVSPSKDYSSWRVLFGKYLTIFKMNEFGTLVSMQVNKCYFKYYNIMP